MKRTVRDLTKVGSVLPDEFGSELTDVTVSNVEFEKSDCSLMIALAEAQDEHTNALCVARTTDSSVDDRSVPRARENADDGVGDPRNARPGMETMRKNSANSTIDPNLGAAAGSRPRGSVTPGSRSLPPVTVTAAAREKRVPH